MGKVFVAALAAAAATTFAAAPGYAAVFDDFNRPDAADLGSNWTQVADSSFISGNQAGGGIQALATYNGTEGATSVSMDVSLSANEFGYVGGVLGWGSAFNYFVKVQGRDGTFLNYAFYTGNNGDGDYFTLNEGFSTGRITVTVAGSVVTLDIVPDAGAVQSYSHDYGTAFSGGLAGLALYQSGRADNFGTDGAVGGGGVPEPATWALMILGFGAAGASMRRRRAALAA